VIKAWIEQTRRRQPENSLRELRRVFERGELSEQNIAELLQIAERHRMPSDREMIYATLFEQLHAGGLTEALKAFEKAAVEVDRVRAGYALKEQFRGREVPERVADAAARIAIAGSSEELRGIAAGLVSRETRDREGRERQLISALGRHPDDDGIQRSIIALYQPDQIDELVVEYAAKPDLSVTFRRRIVNELREQTQTSAGLSPAAENALKEVARSSDDYYLVQYAGSALQAWGISPPLRVAFRNRDNQSMALFVILIALVIVNLVAGVAALVSIFRLPIAAVDKGRRTAIRVGMVAGLVVLSAGMLVLLGAGVIGFMGHNSAPSPKASLLWNIPAYIGTVIYVSLAWLLLRRAGKWREHARS
jgi:energy-converting hydrogenase Eha subunit A